MRFEFIENIIPDSIAAKTIFDNDSNILLSANSKITEKHIEQLKYLGFKGLYVYDQTNNQRQIDLLSDDTRQQALTSLRHINIDNCLFVANSITNEILDNPNVLYELMHICAYDNYTYTHSINVALLATMMGVDMQLPNAKLKGLSQAALLHDIGKTCIPENILNKAGKLTDDEFEIIKKHARYGCMLLSKNELITEDTRLGVLHHHENEDGTGYPDGLTADRIPLFAKIIHVADVYDAMISKRSYKNKINPADVLEYMMGNTELFDMTAVTALKHCVTLYPAGTCVRLSTGQQGVVERNIKGFPQRPVIKLSDGTTINLMTELNITVTDMIT